jgi:aspartate/methionine/tyrosine aminotransferase
VSTAWAHWTTFPDCLRTEADGLGVALGVDFGQAGKHQVRFSYASSEETIREAAWRLGEYWRKASLRR